MTGPPETRPPDGQRRWRRRRMVTTVWSIAIGLAILGAVVSRLGQPDDDLGSAGQGRTSAGPDRDRPGSGATGAAGGERVVGEAFPIVAYQGASELGGDEVDFTSLLGTGRPVVLNFWAGQCPPCRAEMPAFQRVHDRYGSDFLLVGVDIGPFIGLGTRQSAIDLLEELGITYPAAYALEGTAVQDHEVVGMPTTIFYDPDGAEVGRHTGLLTEDQLESRVRDLVGLGA